MKVHINGMRKNSVGAEKKQGYLVELFFEGITQPTEELKRKFTNDIKAYLKKNKAVNIQSVENRDSKKSHMIIYFDKEIKQFSRVESALLNKIDILIEILNNEVLEIEKAEERKIKNRIINNDILNALVNKKCSDWSISECYYKENGTDETYVLATQNSSMDIAFKLNDSLEIEKIKGGSCIEYGEWFDLDPNDSEIILGIKELQVIFNEVKEKYKAIIKRSNSIYRVYNDELHYIYKNKMQGSFYTYEFCKWVAIRVNDEKITEEKFDNLIDCIEYLAAENEKIQCFKCAEDVNPTISIYIEFKDGEDYSQLTDLESEEEVEEYINDLISENQWHNDVLEYSYGLYCPYCLNSLN